MQLPKRSDRKQGIKCDLPEQNWLLMNIPQIPFYCISVIYSNKLTSGQPKFHPFVMSGLGVIALGSWNSENLIYIAATQGKNYRHLNNHSLK